MTDAPWPPVGTVRSPYADTRATPVQSALNLAVEGTVELVPDARPGLAGLADFTHVWLLTWLHQPHDAGPAPLTLVPFLLRDRGERQGVFATRAPRRPTPIGLSLVELVEVTATGFTFRGVDAVDGTPVLDVKPYVERFDVPRGAVRSGWFDTVDPPDGVRPQDLGPA